ncbi:MAG TPA: FMN-binding negative transcriptional regulator [Gaiellales bacterium]
MYVPRSNAIEDEQAIRELVAHVGSAQLITAGGDGYPLATLLPVIWEGDTVIAHMARANDHWRQIRQDSPVLLVIAGPEAYISPSWYPSKREHGKVVPTWNYSAVHLAGRARLHEDAAWLRMAVDELTERHEGRREAPWRSSDAPETFVASQLRGIVGIEIAVERVEGKAKLSQNRSAADQAGVVAGLLQEDAAGARAVADQMRPSSPAV